ncbi:MAG: G5 domain-containing protein [Bacilli bacterium]|nr:G5 domain-containing protein [Bacilli bacterium]
MFLLNKLKVIIIGLANIFSLDFSEAVVEEFKIIDYETEYVYSEKYSKGEELIITKGQDGYAHEVNGKEKIIKESINEVIQLGTRENADYEGMLTGYGPDCVGCSKQGYVACSTENKEKWSLIHDGIIYNDSIYGEVNIVAADHTLFPCGTIIEITNNDYDKLLAVVLDTGGTMRLKWRNHKEVHLDLAFSSEQETPSVTSKNTIYHVKRWGW